MLSNLAGNSFLILAVLVFVTVLLLLESLYVTWRTHRGPEARKFQQRLQMLSASRDTSQQTHLIKERMLSELPLLERWMQTVPRLHSLDRAIVQSGLNWTVSKLLLASAATAVTGWVLVDVVAHQTFLTGAVTGLVLGSLPLAYVNYKRSKRLAKIEQQLPDALDLISRALRAGHAFTSGLKMSGEEMMEPIAGELRTVHEEVNFGVSLEQALTHLSERVPLTDLRYFVVAVLIQRDSGGNLTEILDNLSHLIRERAKLMAKVRVLSSEGRMSAWILALMPFFIGGVLSVANPKFIGPLWTDPMGITMLKYLAVMMVMGILVLRKIIRIRV
jgi:tight adherence protein B